MPFTINHILGVTNFALQFLAMILCAAVLDDNFNTSPSTKNDMSGEARAFAPFMFICFAATTAWVAQWFLYAGDRGSNIALGLLTFMVNVVTFGWACKAASGNGNGDTTKAAIAFGIMATIVAMGTFGFLSFAGGDPDLSPAVGGSSAPKSSATKSTPVVVAAAPEVA